MKKETQKELVILGIDIDYDWSVIFATCTDSEGLLYKANWDYNEDAAGEVNLNAPKKVVRQPISKYGIIAHDYEAREVHISNFEENRELLDNALKSTYSKEWSEKLVNNVLDVVIFDHMDQICQTEDLQQTGVVILPRNKLDISDNRDVLKTVARSRDGREYLLVWDLKKDISRDNKGMIRPTSVFGKTGVGKYRQQVDEKRFVVNQDYWNDRDLFRHITIQYLKEKREEHRLKPIVNISKQAGKGLER